MSLAIIQYGYEVKFGLHKMWGGLDVVLYDSEKNWLYLVEAVTTHGPIDQKRINDLEVMFQDCPAYKIYVTAFPDRATFRKYAVDIAWETEVWLSVDPDHMIHFNGDKFMGPYPQGMNL